MVVKKDRNMQGFYTYKHVFNILLVLNVEVIVFESVNSTWDGLYNKCGNMHGVTLKITVVCFAFKHTF